MCTVSFVPLPDTRFILTSNRDETIQRGLASSPQQLNRHGIEIICPVDPLASGSWIGISEKGRIICLLNGAFKRHQHKPPYRMSRVLVVLDALTFSSVEEFASQYDLAGIEPFTMVLLQADNHPVLHELRWDGNEKYFKKLDEHAFHLWSSPTLYSEILKEEKEKAFRNDLDQLSEVNVTSLLNIHSHFLYEDWVKAPERVEVVATLSITSVEKNNGSLKMHYRDLVRKELPLTSLEIDV